MSVDVRRSTDLEDPFAGAPLSSLLPRTCVSIADAQSDGTDDLGSFRSLLKSAMGKGSDKLLEQIRVVLQMKPMDETTLEIKDQQRISDITIGNSSESQVAGNVDPSNFHCPEVLDDGYLARQWERILNIVDPEEYFLACEKFEIAKKELKKLKGEVSTDLLHVNQSIKECKLRSTIPGWRRPVFKPRYIGTTEDSSQSQVAVNVSPSTFSHPEVIDDGYFARKRKSILSIEDPEEYFLACHRLDFAEKEYKRLKGEVSTKDPNQPVKERKLRPTIPGWRRPVYRHRLGNWSQSHGSGAINPSNFQNHVGADETAEVGSKKESVLNIEFSEHHLLACEKSKGKSLSYEGSAGSSSQCQVAENVDQRSFQHCSPKGSFQQPVKRDEVYHLFDRLMTCKDLDGEKVQSMVCESLGMEQINVRKLCFAVPMDFRKDDVKGLEKWKEEWKKRDEESQKTLQELKRTWESLKPPSFKAYLSQQPDNITDSDEDDDTLSDARDIFQSRDQHNSSAFTETNNGDSIVPIPQKESTALRVNEESFRLDDETDSPIPRSDKKVDSEINLIMYSAGHSPSSLEVSPFIDTGTYDKGEEAPAAGFDGSQQEEDPAAGFDGSQQEEAPAAGFDGSQQEEAPTAGFDGSQQVEAPAAGFDGSQQENDAQPNASACSQREPRFQGVMLNEQQAQRTLSPAQIDTVLDLGRIDGHKDVTPLGAGCCSLEVEPESGRPLGDLINQNATGCCSFQLSDSPIDGDTHPLRHEQANVMEQVEAWHPEEHNVNVNENLSNEASSADETEENDNLNPAMMPNNARKRKSLAQRGDKQKSLERQGDEDSCMSPSKGTTLNPASRGTIKQRLTKRQSLAGAGTKWESGVRRSTRNKIRPLQYWLGEKVLYGRVHQSLTTVIGVKYLSPSSSKLKVESYVSEEYADIVAKAAL